MTTTGPLRTGAPRTATPATAGGRRCARRVAAIAPGGHSPGSARASVLAAVTFTAATAWGALVSLQEAVPGEPFGLRSPGPVSWQIVSGLGSGLSAPWPMPAAVLLSILREPGPPSGRVRTVVGVMVLAGVLAEPVTWGRRRRSPRVASTVALNLVSAVVLLVTGLQGARRRTEC